MARNWTWCFKRALLYTISSSVNERCTLIRTINPNFALKSIRTLTKNTIIIPKFPQIMEGDADYEGPSGYREFLIGTEFGKEAAARVLIKILSFTKRDAEKVIEEFPTLAHVPIKSIVKLFEILREAGLRKTTIIENPFLLTEIGGDLAQKIKIIQKIDIDINDTVHLFHLNIQKLSRYEYKSRMDATYLPDSNRMRYLAGKFNCEIGAICQFLSYNPYILLLDAPKLMSITEYFLESGVAPKDIMSDPISYKYSLSLIKRKITMAKEAGIQPLKLWVLRCTPDAWERCTAKMYRHRTALKPHDSTAKALREVFNCEQEDIEAFAYKLPRYYSICPKKLLRNASLLRDAGYTIQDLQVSPRIVHRKYETLVEYLDMWKNIGGRRRQLWSFCLSRKKFKKCLVEDKYGEVIKP